MKILTIKYRGGNLGFVNINNVSYWESAPETEQMPALLRIFAPGLTPGDTITIYGTKNATKAKHALTKCQDEEVFINDKLDPNN